MLCRPRVAFYRRILFVSVLGSLLAGCGGSGNPSSTTGNSGDSSALTTLHAFALSDGFQPTGLTQDVSGNLYGVTDGDAGTVFEVTPSGVFMELHAFDGSDGDDPSGGLVVASDGTLYGTTDGGPYDAGTIYKITPDGTFSTVYTFMGQDGARPGPLLLGADGNLYGVTTTGGPAFTSMSDVSLEAAGTVYKMTPNGSLTTLYAFQGLDGFMPVALIQGEDGNFYGVTAGGGPTYKNSTQFGAGTVFELTPAGQLTSLYAFDGVTGLQPTTLVAAANGNFYGTALGSSNGNGLVFEVGPNGAFDIIHEFDGTDGQGPTTLIAGQGGNFYGTTDQGGSGYAADSMDVGDGTVFEITPSGNLTTLFSFAGTDGASPDALLLSNNGSLFGVTSQGGEYASKVLAGGTVFELALSSN